MQFSKLRLVGFKSFVEPTDFDILPGLTGIIGPNGCGKSNLVEALRWVMGENSYKSMRASGMDDVIFAGGGDRPARNVAEVGLTLDNAARTAPAAFNDADVLEITRRIERDHGSTYRINGREVRARDVQILFADASTGSRSPALVRQGQIAEIIAAKPQARRRVLEEAAGVAGLHTRRHEAELRLKGAEDNLARIDDLLVEISGRGDELRRQARQAKRFKEVQSDIRRLQAFSALIDWEDARRELANAQAVLAEAAAAVVESTRLQGEAARHQAVAAHALPALRDCETAAGTALQTVLVARQALDGEERRAAGRRAEIERRVKELTADVAREAAALTDASGVLEKLDSEETDLSAHADDRTADGDLQANLAAAEQDRRAAETALTEMQTARANADARRRALADRLRDDTAQFVRLERDAAQATNAHAAFRAALDPEGAHEAAGERLRAATAAADDAEDLARAAEQALDAARADEGAGRAPLAEADRAMQRLETEVRTLTKLLDASSGVQWPPVTDAIIVAKGFEAALGAALGDDLAAPADVRAPAHWAETADSDDPALPAAATALSAHVDAPVALRRRLAQIGLVDRADGGALREQLAPGQRLVSREGDLWRWDGFTQAADALTPAARRLTERNRLADLRGDLAAARETYGALKTAADTAQTALAEGRARFDAARAAQQACRRALDAAREAAAVLDRRRTDWAAKAGALAAAEDAARTALSTATERKAASEAALADLADTSDLTARVDAVRAESDRFRVVEAELRATLHGIARERDTRTRRLAAIAWEREAWRARVTEASTHRGEVAERLAGAQRESQDLAEAPNRFVLARRRILSDLEAAEAALRAASDARAAGEAALAEADRRGRVALDAMAAAREDKARGEARSEAAARKLDDVVRSIATDLECEPSGLPALAGVTAEDERPPAAQITAKLDASKADRDRLGAVNLRAEEELAAMEEQRYGLDKEKDDLTAAIRRLRQAIGSLNKEGRERILEAFTHVNEHFKELFTTLFGGGTAELQLIESDDPLEAGLEILARPPGKKPQVMTLLSGGEQALTAISLIFAVFLTNPSPICVLDEVDAPLDDANVERFCDLVDAVRAKTQTRFIAITHNPITMARMDRLCGVTQAERGISQIVSVDLTEATQLLEAS